MRLQGALRSTRAGQETVRGLEQSLSLTHLINIYWPGTVWWGHSQHDRDLVPENTLRGKPVTSQGQCSEPLLSRIDAAPAARSSELRLANASTLDDLTASLQTHAPAHQMSIRILCFK